MTKYEFLAAIRARTIALRSEDRERSIDYYREMIEDRMEDGLSEEEAVAAMGSIDDVVAQILSENPVSAAPAPAPKKESRPGMTLLLVLGAPLWLPLLLAALIVLLSFYIVFWSVTASFYAVVFSFAAAGLGGILGSLVLLCTGFFSQSLLLFGGGLFCAGLAILSFLAVTAMAKGVVWLSRQPFIWLAKRNGRGQEQ